MKKFFLSLIIPLLSYYSYGQNDFIDVTSNTSFCEYDNGGLHVPVSVFKKSENDGDFSWEEIFGDNYWVDASADPKVVNTNLRVKWTVSYADDFICTDVDQYLALSSSGASNAISIDALPTDWINPNVMTITLTGYIYNSGSVQNPYTAVSGVSASVTCTPKKTFIAPTWPATIDEAGMYNFAVPYIAGVSYDWTFPSGWSHGNGVSSVQGSTTFNTTGGLVSVVTDPEVDACQYPFQKEIVLSSCFQQHGSTDYEFCPPESWTTDLNTDNYGDKVKYPRYVADFNGDGMDDIIGFGHDLVTVGLSNGSTFVTSTWSDQLTYNSPGGWRQDDYPRMLGDFNGDEKMDVVGFNHSATYVMLSTGTDFTGASEWHGGFDYESGYTNRNVVSRIIGDFDGDGDDDVFGMGHNGTEMALSNGSNAFITTAWPGAEFLNANAGDFNDRNKMPVMVGNFNDDEFEDLVIFGHDNVLVALSTGSSFQTTTWLYNAMGHSDGYEQKGSPRMVGDLDGDGIDDIFALTGSVGSNSGFLVGISNGVDGFQLASDWDSNFQGGAIDQRIPGSYDPNDHYGTDEVVLADMNADDRDDLVLFDHLGTYVHFSTGDGFQCHDFGEDLFRSIHDYSDVGPGWYSSKYSIRTVGNIDLTDDEAEIIAFDFYQVDVMNCNNCPNIAAEAEIDSELFITEESGYNGWTVSMNHLCLDGNVILDLAGTSCEDRYQYTISSFDLNNWSSTNLVSTGWIYGKAPATLDITDEVNWVVGQVYKVQFAVGPTWDSKDLFFVFDGNSLIADMSLQGTQVLHYGDSEGPGGALPIEVTNVCDYNGEVKLYPGSSTCYSHYRIEVNPIDHGTFHPNGPAVHTYPSSSGFATGPIMNYHNVLLNSCLLNQIYRVRLYVSDDGGSTFSYTERYVRKIACNSGGRRGPEGNLESEFEVVSPFSVHVYPNPTNGVLNASIGGLELDLNTTVEIYNSVGQKVHSVVVSELDFEVDLSDFSSGIYALKVQNNTNTEIVRIVKN